MALDYLRVTLDDTATHPDEIDDTEMTPRELEALFASLEPSISDSDLRVIRIESASRTGDFDMEDSSAWQSSVQVTCIVAFDPDKFDESIFSGEEYREWPAAANQLLAACAGALKSLGDPRLKFSGQWIVTESEPVDDFEPNPSSLH
jgi:hypothetical protein